MEHMPKRAKELSAIQVKRLTESGRYSVGGAAGLLLQVSDSSARSWLLRATVGQKRRDIGLGPYPDVSLSKAREIAREYRQIIREGRDPVMERKAARSALELQQGKQMTFSKAAIDCHQKKIPEFRNEKHKQDWIRSLERYAFPYIGNLPVSELELPHIKKVLEPIWQEKTETDTRVRQRIETVITYATVNGYRTGENPARWKGNLEVALSDPSKIRKVKHYKALPWQEVGQFMADLRQREGVGARALEFLILTAARSGEVRGMTWDEIDWDRSIWTVPAERIKAGREHKVPLSNDALAVLVKMPRMEGSPYVFLAPRGGMISDMSISAVMKRMGVDAVPHGFRSTFKDWARSCTSYADEVSELALAHVNSDATRAAYARDELIQKRTRLMRDWAKFCNTIKEKGVVTPIRGAE